MGENQKLLDISVDNLNIKHYIIVKNKLSKPYFSRKINYKNNLVTHLLSENKLNDTYYQKNDLFKKYFI